MTSSAGRRAEGVRQALKASAPTVDVLPVALVVRETTAGGPAAPAVRHRRPPYGLILLVLAAALFLAHGSRTIAAPFGDSHDGRNAGVWAAGSQSLREEGPIASRLGTRNAVSGVYANHPPLIYIETALAETVGFGSSASTRAPAWLGSLLVLVLLGRLLRDRGLRPAAAGVAVLLVAVTPMFLVYGTMLDTPMTSLPFGVGLLLLWERGRRGVDVRPIGVGVLAALAVLAGWQSLLLAVIIAGWAAVRLMRRTGRPRVDLGFLGGAAAGLVLLLLWFLWAFGGTLQPLLDQFLYRTGQTQPVALGAVLGAERRDVLTMFGMVALLAAGGLLLGLRDRRFRGLAVLAAAVTLPYPLVFRSGAVNHNYWNYWFLLPVAVGLAVGAEALFDWWASRDRRDVVLVATAASIGVLLTLSAWFAPRGGEAAKLSGYRAAHAIADLELGPGQQSAWYAGAVGPPASWLALATGRREVPLPRSEYAELARTRPTDLVLVGDVRCVAGLNERMYEVRAASSLVDRPPSLAGCA